MEMQDLEVPQTEPADAQPEPATESRTESVVAEQTPSPDTAGGATESPEGGPADQSISFEDLLGSGPEPAPAEDTGLRAVLEAIVYVAEDPLTIPQIAAALQLPPERIDALMHQLMAEFDRPEHGLTIREVAGGYKMATKAEHHDAVRNFVKSLKPPLKLSLPALETLAVIAYKQPVTAPEIMEIRGVQGTGVLKTLLDRKLIAVAGRKNVIGKPILYKSTKEFLIQFGLKDLAELPSLKEFEEIRRMALSETEPAAESGEVPLAEAGPAAAPAEMPAAAEPDATNPPDAAPVAPQEES
jgi:segregation and condensation protein B